MAHVIYENEILSNKLNDTLITEVNLNGYMTVDTSLAGAAGMKKVINKYAPTSESIEALAMGEGNTKTLEAAFTPEEYEMLLWQGRMAWFDEQEMTDPQIVDALIKFRAEEMTNYFTKLAIAEFDKASLTHQAASWSFDAVVDAIAMLNLENESGLFMLISPKDKAALRKALKDDLNYSEAYVRTGYIGTVCGVPVIVSKAVEEGKAYLATKEAVTLFIKKDTETEYERDANVRNNTYYIRKVGLTALTDATKVVAITIGA